VRTAGGSLVLAIVTATPAPAGADDVPAEVPEVREGTAIERDGGWLTLQPLSRPASEGFGGVEHGEQVELRLSPDTRVLARGSWWQNEERELPALGDAALGWSAGLQLQHDFGWARLIATGGVSFTDSRLGQGHYIDVGLQLRRDFRLSRWMRAWISLGFFHRYWLENVKDRPLGELDTTDFSLSIGTTFR
jgi:hypothetical protein